MCKTEHCKYVMQLQGWSNLSLQTLETMCMAQRHQSSSSSSHHCVKSVINSIKINVFHVCILFYLLLPANPFSSTSELTQLDATDIVTVLVLCVRVLIKCRNQNVISCRQIISWKVVVVLFCVHLLSFCLSL